MAWIKSTMCSVLFISAVNMAVYAETSSSQTAQRQLFQKWRATHDSLSQSEQQHLLNQMVDYALYPYAYADYVKKNSDQIALDEILAFKKSYPKFPKLNTILQNYTNRLVKEERWDQLVQLNAVETVALQCQTQYARYKMNNDREQLAEVAQIWVADYDLPKACDPLFKVWSTTPYKTETVILERVQRLLDKNKISLAKVIAKQLPESSRKTAIIQLLEQPDTLPTFMAQQAKNNENKALALNAFKRYAPKHPEQAKGMVDQLTKTYGLSQSEKMALNDSIAQTYFKSDATPSEISWRQNQIKTSQNGALIEREIRLALAHFPKTSSEVAQWLDRLSEEDKQKEEWIYWRARVLRESGDKKRADQLLKTLVSKRGFYAMISAQELGIPYTVDLDYRILPEVDLKKERQVIQNRYKNQRIVHRIEELKHFNMHSDAKREWYMMSTLYNASHSAALSRFAYDRGWGAESVQATIAGKHWDYWQERLPVVFEETFHQHLNNKTISKTLSLAVARQESALDPSVESPAGAKGLMQLMPSTAKEVAKKLPELHYTSTQQLFDPKVNIALGTTFLELVYTQFDQNRILAAAAYNAGPNRVKQWLNRSNGELDAIAFIESIPFNETRNYVKSVLTYDYLYQYLLKENPAGVLTQRELSMRY